MKHFCPCIIVALFSVAVFAAERQEQAVTPTLERVALFKNGYIIVQQNIDVPAPGLYRWDNVPVAVHGTFFAESDLAIEIRSTHRETVIPPAYSTASALVQQRERKPVLLFDVKALSDRTAGQIRMIYLTQGATWAPSYRVKLLDNKRLTLEQNVILLNEWMPIRNAEIALVSGFPQVETSGVLSPLHPDQTLRQFLAQLIGSPTAGLQGDTRGFMSQRASVEAAGAPRSATAIEFDLTTTPIVEGPDIHYNNIGKRTLEVGDSLSLTTGKAATTYERVLSCNLSELMLGYWKQHAARGANIQVPSPDVFEVVKFNNPLSFPMTTAPVMVTDSQRFLGQSKTNWVNPKQPASVNIAKVMNVSVTYFDELDLSRKPEVMPPNPSSIPQISGFGGESANIPLWGVGRLANHSNIYRLCPIQGTIEITNRREEAITLHLASAMIGVVDLDKKLIADCDVPPKTQTLISTDREYAPNSVARLYWEITLQPGEEKTITIKSSRWTLGM